MYESSGEERTGKTCSYRQHGSSVDEISGNKDAIFLGSAKLHSVRLHSSPNCIEAALYAVRRKFCGARPCFSQNSKTFLQSYLNENWMR